MSQANTFFNLIVLAAIIAVGTYFAITPKPLPDNSRFKAEVEKPGMVLVKFGAPWCPPCRQIEGELDQLAHSSAGHLSIVKVDVDQQRELAQYYGISGIPHLILFKDGKQVGSMKGFRTRDQLQTWVASQR